MINNCYFGYKPRMGAENQKNPEVWQEDGNKIIWSFSQHRKSQFRKDKMSTYGTGVQYWKITEKLKKLLKLTREFGERTLLISAQCELVCIIMFCSILSFEESHKLQWLNRASENFHFQEHCKYRTVPGYSTLPTVPRLGWLWRASGMPLSLTHL